MSRSLVRSLSRQSAASRSTRAPMERIDKKIRRRIEQLTAQVDVQLEKIVAADVHVPQELREAMRYTLFTGGKRFRPLLVLGACEAVGGSLSQAMKVACAIELIHTYSLVHDDLPAMDNADTRRGKPACHKQYDEGLAILVGDALLTLSFEVLSTVKHPNAIKIIQRVAHACGASGLIGGQVLDLDALSNPNSVTEAVVRDIARRKTGALMNVSVVSGALTGNASTLELRRLDQFGFALGDAFQQIDDVHDKDGLVQKISLESVRLEAQRTIRKAIDGLKPFEARADVLRQLATWLGATL